MHGYFADPDDIKPLTREAVAPVYDHLPNGYFADTETGEPLDFSEPIVYCRWVRDGSRDVIITHPILFIDPLSDEWKVRCGFRTSAGNRGRARDAEVVKNMACQTRGVDWDKAAWVYYYCLLTSGVGPIRSKIRWFRVRFPGKFLNWITSGRLGKRLRLCCWKYR